MRAHEIEPCVQKGSVQIILFGAVFATLWLSLPGSELSLDRVRRWL
jgi:hypothetical protein